MLPQEGEIFLSQAVSALPVWMEEQHAAKSLFELAAQRGIPAFVRVPPKSIVIEEPLFPRNPSVLELASMQAPMISMMDRQLKDQGIDVMLHPVANPAIRFLELEPQDLKTLAVSGQVRLHWFKAGALSVRANALSREPRTLRCIRPAKQTDTENNQPASRLWSAITHDKGSHEYSFAISDAYIQTVDAQAFKHVLFKPEIEDPHHLFDSAPAVFGVYSAARKYALELEAIPRSQAPRDKKRLEEVRQKVIKHLAGFGRPLESEATQTQVLKFIDPKFSWGSGAGHKSFAEAASTIQGFYDKYAYENFVGEGLGLIIYLAERVIAQRFEERQGKRGPIPLTEGSVHAQLRRLNFTGNAEIEAIAAVIRWEGPKAKRKTESERRPGPVRAQKR
jgi:hypothetical protein